MDVFSPHQWRLLHGWLGSPLRRLGRLRDRLNRTHFTPEDPYVQSVTRAYNAMQEVLVRTHYMSADSGVADANQAHRSSDAVLWCGDGI